VAESADAMPAGMVLISAGTFMMPNAMGDSPENASTEYPVHEVYVCAFYMDQYDERLTENTV
jgi:formylglycine-generating enzyme required for sulfatase activity